MKQEIHLFSCFAATVIITTFFACKKDKKEDSAGKSKTELLTAGSWKMTGYIINPAQDVDGDGDTETNAFDYLDDCLKDDITTYKTDGTAEQKPGAIKCDPNIDETYVYNWKFTNNETKIEILGIEEVNLVELTTTVLKLSYSYVDAGITYTATSTFGH